MVVAADDGVMPQTREHAAVLAALGVNVGVVAITKTDLASPDRAAAEAAELLPGAEIVPVSVRSGAGLDALRAALARAAARVASRHLGRRRCACTWTACSRCAAPARSSPARCGRASPRAATTCWCSRPAARAGPRGRGPRRARRPRRGGPARRAEPRRPGPRRGRARRRDRRRRPAARRRARHAASVARATRRRGAAARGGGAAAATYRVDVAITWATPDARPDGGARIAVHHGTRESAAKLVELGGRFFQLRLESPIVPAAGDRLVIRSLAPPDTLGGGVVLDPAPRRHGPSRDLLARLARLERGEPEPEVEPAAPVAAPALAPLDPRALALEEELRAAGHEPPLDSSARVARRAARARARGPARADDAHPRRRARRGPRRA